MDVRADNFFCRRSAENSVDLAFALMGLQDVYELENFDIYKQNMLTALAFCCPTLVAP